MILASHDTHAKKHRSTKQQFSKSAFKRSQKEIKTLKKLLQELQNKQSQNTLNKISKKKLKHIEKLIQSSHQLLYNYFQNIPKDIKASDLKSYRLIVYSLLQETSDVFYQIIQQKVCLNFKWRVLLSKSWQIKHQWKNAARHLTQALACYHKANLWFELTQVYKQMKDPDKFQKAMNRFKQSQIDHN